MWRRLSHPNVISFMGAAFPDYSPVALVSLWMENGDIVKYTKANPRVNRLDLVSTTKDVLIASIEQIF